MSTSKNILENLKKKYQQEYGVAVFDIDVVNTKSGIIMKGKILTENQRDEVLEEFKKNKIKIKNENIKVLSDAEKRNEIGWAAARNKIIDLKSRFISNKIINNKILNRIRCSQALKGEILRVLYKYEDQLLVQQNDLTLGWVNGKDAVFRKINSSPDKGKLGGVRNRGRLDLYKKWRKGNYAIKGKAVFAKRLHGPEYMGTMEPADKPANKIIKEAEKYLGAKYVLGGKSKNGIDCSGLVQIAYKNSLDIILPKHSWDQKKVGRKVKLENIKTGDLIFLIKKENGHKHVGIAEIALENNPPNPPYQGGANLIHASLNKKKVVRQKLEEVFESHNFVEARRIISL